MIDTGCNINLFKYHAIPEAFWTEQMFCPETINGSKVPLRRMFTGIPFSINGSSDHISGYQFEFTDADCLLGMNFLQKIFPYYFAASHMMITLGGTPSIIAYQPKQDSKVRSFTEPPLKEVVNISSDTGSRGYSPPSLAKYWEPEIGDWAPQSSSGDSENPGLSYYFPPECSENDYTKSSGPSKGKQIATDGATDLSELDDFYQQLAKLPKRIVFFRDGVSETQFYKVLQEELHGIKAACSRFPGYKPPITFAVVQKRHHTRLLCIP